MRGKHKLSMRYLCATYARAMREITPRPLGWLISWPLQLCGGRKYRFGGASLAPSVFGLVVKTANTHKTNGIQ